MTHFKPEISLSLEQIYKLRDDLQAEIKRLLQNFSDQTSLDIDSISIQHVKRLDESTVRYLVELDIKLRL